MKEPDRTAIADEAWARAKYLYFTEMDNALHVESPGETHSTNFPTR